MSGEFQPTRKASTTTKKVNKLKRFFMYRCAFIHTESVIFLENVCLPISLTVARNTMQKFDV